MSWIGVAGIGAVSPAGWGVPALRAALEKGDPLPGKAMTRPGGSEIARVRPVPELRPLPAWSRHPRLRRASAITEYALGALLEARSMAGEPGNRTSRLGLIVCLSCGCVQYTERFFGEVLKDPGSASPLLFPETVFNAPASHVAAVIGSPPETCTLLGDSAVFLQGLDLAAAWLMDGRVDECLVAAAEESNWLLSDALARFDRRLEAASGAGALLLTASRDRSLGIELCEVTDLQSYSGSKSRPLAAQRVRALLPPSRAGDLLCDSRVGCPSLDEAENAAWANWQGPRLSPKEVLGEGLIAASAWQCVAAVDALLGRRAPAVFVSVVGPSEAAAGARLARVDAP